jgi:hypothetical protein
MTQRTTVAVSEGVEDDDAEGIEVAEVDAGSIAVVGSNSYVSDKSSLLPLCDERHLLI